MSKGSWQRPRKVSAKTFEENFDAIFGNQVRSEDPVSYEGYIPPCPFCGGRDLAKNNWSLDGGEVDAIECNGCLAGAPLTTWVERDGH